MNKFKNKFFSPQLPIRLVLFNICTFFSLFGGCIALIVSIATQLPLIQDIIVLFALIFLILALYLANYKNRLSFGTGMIIVLITMLLFPFLFITGGGASAGMSHWFVLGILFTFLLVQGKLVWLIVCLQALIYTGCFLIDFYFPQYILSFGTTNGNMLDIYQSMLVCAFLGGLVIRFQMYSYNQILQKNNEQKEQLKEMAQKATEANQAKGEFLSRMSHDIRTPINGIIGMLEIAEKNEADISKVKECHHKIHIASEHLLALINDVLDVSKLESSAVEISCDPMDIREILNNCSEILAPMAQENNISYYLYGFEDIEHPYILGSPLQLRQILVNIVSNAIKYNKPNGKVSMTVRELDFDPHTVTYEFSIEDTGIGMSTEFQHHMFEPFSQEDESASYKYRGSGLGLSIVKKMVDLMHGDIQVYSTLGIGSRFVITIPFAKDTHPEHKQVPLLQPNDISVKGLRILIVEDNELNMEIAQYILEDAGAIVTTATNGQMAVDIFTESSASAFDIILMDVMMPVMDGLKATRTIRQSTHPRAQSIPIIAMTANAFAEDMKKSKDAGMNAHLAKPLDTTKMLRTISMFCSKQAYENTF